MVIQFPPINPYSSVATSIEESLYLAFAPFFGIAYSQYLTKLFSENKLIFRL